MTNIGFFLGSLIGWIFGGFLGTAILAAIIEKVAFKDREPDHRATATVGLAWIFVGIIAGLGYADGESFVWYAGLYYLPGAAIVWFWYRRRYRNAWVPEHEA